MTLLRDLRRLAAFVFAPAALSAALLSACGGGTSQVDPFQPTRLIALGDENSAFFAATDASGKPDGFRYTINDRATATTTGQCRLLPTAIQRLATLHYGLVFEECNVAGATPSAFALARPQARVEGADGLAAQLARISGSALGANDMVTVWIGSNDVVALYEQVAGGTMTAAAAVAEAQRLGRVVAAQVNAVIGTGARAMVLTIPNLGLSPYARAAASAGAAACAFSSGAERYKDVDMGACALMGALSWDFNAELRTNLLNDGRKVGLVLPDEIVAVATKSPSSFLSSPANAAAPACAVTTGGSAAEVADALRACTTTNLVTPSGTSASTGPRTHLWASDRHLGPVAHELIGNQAASRAVENPF